MLLHALINPRHLMTAGPFHSPSLEVIWENPPFVIPKANGAPYLGLLFIMGTGGKAGPF